MLSERRPNVAGLSPYGFEAVNGARRRENRHVPEMTEICGQTTLPIRGELTVLDSSASRSEGCRAGVSTSALKQRAGLLCRRACGCQMGQILGEFFATVPLGLGVQPSGAV